MAGGRPTSYSKEMVEKTLLYLKTYEDEPINHLVPTVAGLCGFLGVARSTVYKWSGEHPEFSDTLKQIEESQEVKLVNGGLGGGFNNSITKMMLTNHGYSDKVQQDNVSSDGSMSPKGRKLDDFYKDSDV